MSAIPSPEIMRKATINFMLAESAWTQLPDNYLSQAESDIWNEYRELLQAALIDPNTPIPDTPAVSNSPLTVEQLAARARRKAARGIVVVIPGWATWTPEEADAWGNSNIGIPLTNARATLPTTLTLATARASFVVLLGILDKMWAMQQAMAKMLIALRDHNFSKR